MENNLFPVKFNISAAFEHGPDIKMPIRIIKDSTMTLYDIPYNVVHPQLVAYCV